MDSDVLKHPSFNFLLVDASNQTAQLLEVGFKHQKRKKGARALLIHFGISL
jgi:hypothetical protein